MEKWVKEKLSELLDFQIQDDFVQFVMQIENERDLESYFATLLDSGNPKHRQFVVDFKKQRASYTNQMGYKKTNNSDNVSNKQNEKKKGKARGKENAQLQETAKVETKPEKTEKKKTKYVNLLSHGDVLLKDSLKQRDKLLEFDRNSARRTKVIDDESDYYQSNNIWLSAEDREKLRKQESEAQARKHASRLDKRICYAKFIDMGMFGTSKKNDTWNTESRIQDKEYLEMSDQGLCLSMHQPYASLLVAGIKIHEGRTWYSSHRGRLWIASAAKVPSPEDISNTQHLYNILKDRTIKFPETYPTSCLLGCVTVTDVLPQEEYRKLYPEGESDSPYVFICENPYMLPINFHIKGKHKIYKMDKKIHQTASKYLDKVMRMVNN
ncbi:Activating signal cointegrator 1 [Camponotus floridanus]|uniref:Activating signal cointegrator 1 n=1 Tax=Camponotus floridanus TaxID=104421 RepID=E2AET1_CAMFO|nr:Activating signal cointegrator 1 [Camponotus floridanus]